MDRPRFVPWKLPVLIRFFSDRSRYGFLLALLSLQSIAAIAQRTYPAWLQAFGSSGTGNNIGNGIKVGPDQNLYVTGQFSATATFGSTTVTAIGPFDIFLAKYSPSGALLWIAQTSLCLHAVATTPAGWWKLFDRTLPLHRPSPSPLRIGTCITVFEACSAFTRVTACTLAESL